MLQNLRDLTINNNLITKIDGINKLINLRSLSLDRNKITKIEGLKTLRKLEKLSLIGNLLTDVLPQDTTESMLEIRELYLNEN